MVHQCKTPWSLFMNCRWLHRHLYICWFYDSHEKTMREALCRWRSPQSTCDKKTPRHIHNCKRSESCNKHQNVQNKYSHRFQNIHNKHSHRYKDIHSKHKNIHNIYTLISKYSAQISKYSQLLEKWESQQTSKFWHWYQNMLTTKCLIFQLCPYFQVAR